MKKRVMNVCVKHPADDIRVHDKIAGMMAAQGYEVHNSAPNAETGRTDGGIYIHGFCQKPGMLNRILSHRAVYACIQSVQPACMIAHEPDALAVAYRYYKKMKRKGTAICLIFDCHEAYEQWYDHATLCRWLNSILNRAVDRSIKYYVKRIDAVLSVNQKMTDRYAAYNANSYMIPSICPPEEVTDTVCLDADGHTAVFFGQFGRSRQTEMFLDAADILKRKKIPFSIGIVGGDGHTKDESPFMRAVAERGLEEYFNWYGWLDRKAAFAAMRSYPVGIIRFDAWVLKDNFALPNKVFEYMANGLALLACRKNLEICRIVEDNDCGVLIDDETGADLASAIEFIIANPERVMQYRRNALSASKSKYSAEVYGQKLKSIMEAAGGAKE